MSRCPLCLYDNNKHVPIAGHRLCPQPKTREAKKALEYVRKTGSARIIGIPVRTMKDLEEIEQLERLWRLR